MSSSEAASAASGARVVEELQQLVSRELDLFVTPLGGAIVAGDQACSMQTPEVAVHERIAGLRLIRGTFGKAEMPLAVFLPRVGLEERWRLSMSWRAFSTARSLTTYDAIRAL